MKKNVYLGLASLLLLAGMGNALAETTEAHQETAAAIEQANLINKLIAYGDARHDPILLLAAAKLQKALSGATVPTSTESSKNEDVLQRAKKAANGSKEIAALADDIKASKAKSYDNYYSGNYNSFHEQLRRAY